MPKPVQHGAAKEKALELALLFPSWTVPRIYEELTALQLIKKRRGFDEPVPTLRTVQAWVRPVRQLDKTPWNPDLFSPAEFRAIARVHHALAGSIMDGLTLIDGEQTNFMLLEGRSFTQLEATHIARFAQIVPDMDEVAIWWLARQRILADATKRDASFLYDILIRHIGESEKGVSND